MNFTRAIALIGAVLFVHFVAIFFGVYETVKWFDIPMHFAGGFAIGTFGLALWEQGIDEIKFSSRLSKHIHWWIGPLFIIGFVAIVGIGWEWFEFILDTYFTSDIDRLYGYGHQPSIADTMADFAFDLAGGFVAVLAFFNGYEKR